ncbi:uncharacterized protein LOC112571147 [Pomacea canaliculata]|uniref:uncharacterized protein LOC112571147 n=1 Tax=Pomacea canaliculata TaxID=400727 RepID=UPI000D73260A|nr:uncharacterized protein LOC112571147 [Pomacea canaliculata]
MTSNVIRAPRSFLHLPEMMQRHGTSLEDCAEACALERQIKCRYFKYLNETHMCLLSSSESSTVRRMAQDEPPEDTGTISEDTVPSAGAGEAEAEKQPPAKAPLKFQELEETLENLREQEENMDKMKHVIADLHDEVNMLKKLHMSDAHKLSSSRELQDETTALLTRRIVNLKVDGEKFKAAMHALSNMQRILAKEIGSLKDEQKDVLIKLSEIEKSASELETMSATLKGTDGALQRDVDSVKDGISDLALRIDKLRSIVNKQISENKMSPLLIKIKHNQGALATALESVSEKVAGLIAEMPAVASGLRRTDQKVSNQALYAHELQGKLKVLYQNLIQIKKDIGDLLDPRSEVNMERAKGILKLRSDVSMLAEMDKGIKSEIRDQKEDMARLIKDVARVQLMAQNMKDKLTLVLTASRQFQQDINVLKEGQKNGLSVVEVAEMQKQVLVALNRLKTREALVMKQMQKYRESVQRVAQLVQDSQSQKSRTQRLVLQLQSRFRHLEAEIQELFYKTRSIASKMQHPQNMKGMAALLRSQAHTNAKLTDLAREFDRLQVRVEQLSMEFKDEDTMGPKGEMELVEGREHLEKSSSLDEPFIEEDIHITKERPHSSFSDFDTWPPESAEKIDDYFKVNKNGEASEELYDTLMADGKGAKRTKYVSKNLRRKKAPVSTKDRKNKHTPVSNVDNNKNEPQEAGIRASGNIK